MNSVPFSQLHLSSPALAEPANLNHVVIFKLGSGHPLAPNVGTGNPAVALILAR